MFPAVLELTDLLGRESCPMQGTDNSSIFVTVMKNLKEKLRYIRKYFSDGIIPDISHESYAVLPLRNFEILA